MSDKQLALNQEPSVGMMLQTFIEQGITKENVDALDRLCQLKERSDAKAAEQEFNRAFVAMQSEMPDVQATQIVPGSKEGEIRYRYAPYEGIMEKVKPGLKKHGFAVTYNTRREDGRVVMLCTLMHTGGHSRTNEYAVRIGKGPPSTSESQQDGAAMTYAKRGALCNCLNITIDVDDDARAEGAKIDPMDADSIRDRVKALGLDESKFLRFAAASSYEEIREDKYDEILAILSRKEAEKSAK